MRQFTSVVILMCTYNGEKFLTEQLDSLTVQTHKNWRLIVSDDGSSDATLKILKGYQARWLPGQLEIRGGPQKGFCLNFLSLACDPEIQADYYAFCDQDDVWLPTKLTVALENIKSYESPEGAYVYCGRTIYVNEECHYCGMSPLFKRPTSFGNALVQSVAGGNTMVFNRPSKLLIEKAGSLSVVSHDWWVYQLITGAGGIVFYDSNPHLLYRQHEMALVGGNTSFVAKFRRMFLVFKGRFKSWNNQNSAALNQIRYLLSSKNQGILEAFDVSKQGNLKQRLSLIHSSTLYRQTNLGTISLYIALFLKKI